MLSAGKPLRSQEYASDPKRKPSEEMSPCSWSTGNAVIDPPSGCRFHTRCWLRRELGDPERCVAESPALRELRPGHHVACHFAEELAGDKRDELIQVAAMQVTGRTTDLEEAITPVEPHDPAAADDAFIAPGSDVPSTEPHA